MMAKWEAKKNGYDEIILTDSEGYVTEAPTSNVFIVSSEGVLMTAHEDDILHGITRMSILEIADDEGLKVNVGKVPLKDLEEAREVFVTSSSHLVCPVIKIDGNPVGDGNVGEITNLLKQRFQEVISGKNENYKDWLTKIDKST